MLCVDPLTGTTGGSAGAGANKGALVPDAGMTGATLVPGLIPARCSPQGLLLIGDPPGGYAGYVLPGNNYHVFDYALFWANVRVDAAARLATFQQDEIPPRRRPGSSAGGEGGPRPTPGRG
jgi:hypothetical protein